MLDSELPCAPLQHAALVPMNLGDQQHKWLAYSAQQTPWVVLTPWTGPQSAAVKADRAQIAKLEAETKALRLETTELRTKASFDHL